MVRRHGWQLPAHTFQVVAITVFFLLAVAFYVFLAPFMWFHALEFASLAVYSPLAFTVFILYIRSSAIDPADPGVFARQPSSKQTGKGFYEDASGATNAEATRLSPGLSTPSRSSSVMPSDNNFEPKTPYFDQPRVGWQKRKSRISFSSVCGLLCGWVVKDDGCREDSKLQQPVAEEDVLFCTLCNAEVRKFSKHCRSCDKCVDGFDHHCRWLNNCVGRKNYNTFVALMATSLSLLVLEWGIGMAVLVRCFVDRKGVEHQIVDKLGNGFSRAPFATVVALCTLVSLLASIPLGELFFFHLILIRKGITTYEYVVAMRAQNEPQGFSVEGGEAQSVPTSPSSSTATGLSGSSSLGLQYNRGAWCTPPRVFVEHQDEVVPHLGPGRVPSTTDPDARAAIGRHDHRPKKGNVRISAWKLAKLNADDATRAVAKARESSSILRQLGPRDPGLAEGYTSSSNISSRSSMSAEYLTNKWRVRDDSSLASVKADLPPIRTSRDDSSIQYETAEVGARSRSSCSSPSHTMTDSTSLSPLPAERRYGTSFPTSGLRNPAPHSRTLRETSAPAVVGGPYLNKDARSHHATVLSHSSADFSRAWSGPAASSDGYEASSGESADDGALPRINQYPSRGRVLPDHVTLSVKEGKKAALYWDRSSGVYGPLSTGRVEGSRGTSSHTTGSRCDWPEPPASPSSLSDDRASSIYAPDRISPLQSNTATHDTSPSLPRSSLTLDNLVYSGTSIFYGGPIAEPPVVAKEDTQKLPPKPPTNPKVSLAKPSVPPENKPPTRIALRSQSPVFAPRAMLSFSPLGPGATS